MGLARYVRSTSLGIALFTDSEALRDDGVVLEDGSGPVRAEHESRHRSTH